MDSLISNTTELTKLCRMCLKNEKILKSMFYCKVGEYSYAEIYEQCTGFNISNSICTTSICANCENNLLFVYEFKQKMQENEGKLEQLILLKKQNDHQNIEIEKQFLGIDDNFLDFRIESLDELEKSFSECKFKSIINSVKCITCLDNCETEKTINELNAHESYPILCECGDLIDNRTNFLEHYAQTHSLADKTSNEHLSSSPELRTQIIRVHSNDSSSSNVDSSSERDHQRKAKKLIWKCPTCNFKFIRSDSLKRHLLLSSCLNHVPPDFEITQEYAEDVEVLSEDEIVTAERPATKKPTKSVCKICGEEFNHRSTRLSHMARKHGAKNTFECRYCDYSTLKRDRFQAHVDKHENPDKTFDCTICNQKFSSINTMNLHRAQHSSQSLTFMCSFCDKIFLDKRNYNTHLRLHTRENLFYCTHCQRGFNRKEHLKNHLKRKNNNCDKNARDV